MDDLTPNGNNKILFGNTFKSDGFSVDLLFYRREKKKDGTGVELALEDFNYEEVINQYQPVFLDPGHKSLFTAVVGVELLTFYGKETAKCHFQLYQGRQRAPEMMVNMLTHGTAKYNKFQRKKKGKKNVKRGKKKKKKPKIDGGKENEGLKSKLDTTAKKLKWKPLPFREEKEKCPLVVFGDGVFGKDMVKLKNLRCGVVGKLFQTLKKRETAGALIVLTIDEFKTSKTCSSCFYSNLGVVKITHFKGNSVLACQNCNKVWQRDAAWMGEGRPEPFKREKTNA
ncbi:uncharacterized protein B0P05DRAFT_580302 [Gilbertella persicaria]|uniref:uncharacterized protein n=1 Tax=Gilbertella persicaria TaxID=101096 RepID=UPI00222031FB|nr:uncharacterized protein B0P05DRAFT_580302 [Gilbertella persicaria]KAI8072172.1 hypothetical protein B0P05DRAFT_580302 [Gilbertella persicaria]